MAKHRVRLLAVGAAAAVVLIVGAFVWRNAPVSFAVARPSERTDVRIFGLGSVEARVLSKVSFEVGAALLEVSVDHGDRVAKGAVLARLHSAEQEAKVARAKAALSSAEVGVKRAEAQVVKAQAVLAQKQEANRRKQSLATSRIVSEQTAEEAVRDEAVARADLAVAQAEVEVAKAQQADARAALAYETTILDHHTLRAPYDALVVERHLEPGTVAKIGEPVFTLIAPETVWALAHVDEAQAGAITEGQPVEVRLRSLPTTTFRARVARIGLESDRVTEERRVWVKCEACPPRFFLGEQAEVLIKVAELKNALLVPEKSVRSYDGRSALVWTIEDGRLAERRVSIGHRTEDSRLEVTAGLPEGALIALDVPQAAPVGHRARARQEPGQ